MRSRIAIFVLFFSIPCYATSPVAHWAFDETSGSVAYDSVGSNAGTLYGNQYWLGGQINGALGFDGTSYVEVSGYKGVSGMVSRTCSAWINTGDTDGAIMYWGDASGNGKKWNFLFNDSNGTAGAIQVSTGGGYIVGSTNICDDNWHHVAAVLINDGTPDVSEIKLYVDGVEEAYSDVLAGPINTGNDEDVLIGALNSGGDIVYHFHGKLDDVRLYYTALDAGDIQQLYDEGVGSLEVIPPGSFVSNGNVGGQFSPVLSVYQLTNLDASPMDWDIQSSVSWLDVSSTSGTLSPGESTTVTVSINSTADALAFGGYTDDLIFRDVTNPSNIKQVFREVLLGVGGDLFVPSQYPSIQSAIDVAGNGDVIVVDPGTYDENIDFSGKSITVTSVDPDDPDIVESTIIHGDGSTSVVTFANYEWSAVISGFTITGGYGQLNLNYSNDIYWGSGIYCYQSSPTIRNNIIVGNLGAMSGGGISGYGGGIGSLSAYPAISNNTIMQNEAYAGGGILAIDGDCRISSNLIYDNLADIGGGVVLLAGRLVNNTLAGNDAVTGGNVFAQPNSGCGQGVPGMISNNIICNAQNGGGLYWESTLGDEAISNNNVWGNVGDDYYSTSDQTGLNGNISADPMFVDEAGDDYRISFGSSCINAGGNDFVMTSEDIDGEARIFAMLVDIGADEYVDHIPPIADAGPDQATHTNPSLITLDGSGSWFYDAGGVTEYQWTQVDGPAVVLSDETAVSPTFTASEYGTYIFELVANDAMYFGVPNAVSIAIENNAPIADAGVDETYDSVPQLVSLDGSGSIDPDGDAIVGYHWIQTEGPLVVLSDPNIVNPSFLPSAFGIHVFQLVVNDGDLDSEGDTLGIVIGNNHAPVAVAGGVCYADEESVTLDGTGSFDPDGYGELSYQWTKVYGGTVTITGADTATPVISDFAQESYLSGFWFELVVSDGCLESEPVITKIKVVPDSGEGSLSMEGRAFDPEKPTIVYFGGGNGVDGSSYIWSCEWSEKANFIIPIGGGIYNGYNPPYERWGDKLIVFLSKYAPNYNKAIQTFGYSTGGNPSSAVGAYLNTTYADKRYDVNRVTFLDGCVYTPSVVDEFLGSSVDGEQCWLDSYRAGSESFCPGPNVDGALNVYFPDGNHGTPGTWYQSSLNPSSWSTEIYNGGITAGAYFSVIGPGKNLQLASGPTQYHFEWVGDDYGAGYLDFYNESAYPGKFPKPVTLVGPADGGMVDPNGVVLTCEVSENSVRYQLLLGPDERNVKYIYSDTTTPPELLMTEFPFEKTWWTIKVYDAYGSSIYADPIRFFTENYKAKTVHNLRTLRSYPLIQVAIDEAVDGQTIEVEQGVYYENIDLNGKNIILRSSDPYDISVVNNTIIDGGGLDSVVRFAGSEDATCQIVGLTIRNGNSLTYGGGISGNNAEATIRQCVITGNASERGGGISHFDGIISKCVISNNFAVLSGAGLVESDALVENSLIVGNSTGHGGGLNDCNGAIINCTIVNNNATVQGGGFRNCSGEITNCIIWGNSVDQLYGSSNLSFSCIQDLGSFDEGNTNADPLFVDGGNGDYHLQSTGWRWDMTRWQWTWDDVTSSCIDAGNPGALLGEEAATIEDDPQGLYGENVRINMGAYGGTGEASMGPLGWVLLSDINNDGVCDVSDLAVFAGYWLGSGEAIPADFNRDGKVGLGDFALLGYDWGE